MRKLLVVICLAVIGGGSLAVPQPTAAAFPGANGRIVFMTEEPGKAVIATITTAGTDITYLTQPNDSPSEFGDGRPMWSPGGTQLVFARYDDEGNGDIWRMKADGSSQQRLTADPADDDWPAWSPDGSKIVFASNRLDNYELYSMNLDGSGLKRLTTNAAFDFGPVWSPNNDKIAFSSDRGGGPLEIWTMNADGTGLDRLTTGTIGDTEANWSADGSYITFVRTVNQATDADLWRVNVATKVASAIRVAPAFQVSPALAADPGAAPANGLVFVTNELGPLDVSIMSAAGGATTTVTDDYDFDVFQVDWQAVPAFPLVDARFSGFKADIEWVYAEGITAGCSAERYCPGDPVTREQMASFLARALGLTGNPPDAFTDDNNSTHQLNINRLAAAGITSGCAPSRFCPKDPVARDQMASFLSRALALTGTPDDAFTDDNGNTHELNINRLFAAGVTSGCGGTKYCPGQTVSRGQMAAFLHRAFD